MKPLSQARINAVLALSASDRYDHFIKQAVAWGKVWGLYDAGWAMLGDKSERPLMPLWPAPEYAQLCATATWPDSKPGEIEVHELLDICIPTLRREGSGIAVFPNPALNGAVPDLEMLVADLREELSRVE